MPNNYFIIISIPMLIPKVKIMARNFDADFKNTQDNELNVSTQTLCNHGSFKQT